MRHPRSICIQGANNVVADALSRLDMEIIPESKKGHSRQKRCTTKRKRMTTEEQNYNSQPLPPNKLKQHSWQISSS